MHRTLIVPGLFGSGEDHWQRHWLRDNPGSVLIEQSDWQHPRLEDWMARLEAALEAGPAYVVAHSLGCLLTAAVARGKAARNIRGALLVAPCDLVTTRGLHPGHIDFPLLQQTRLPFPTTVVGSLNDIYMSLDQVTEISREWGAELRVLGQAGHINIDSGYGRWTGAYGLFSQLRVKAEHRDKIPASRKTVAYAPVIRAAAAEGIVY